MSAMSIKAILWLLLAIGIATPMTMAVQSLSDARLPLKRYHARLVTVGIGPLRLIVSPRFWPAVLVLLGAGLTGIGMAAMSHGSSAEITPPTTP